MSEAKTKKTKEDYITIAGFSRNKGDDNYFGDVVKDLWADTGLSTDSADIEIIVEYITRRALELNRL